MKSLVGWKVPRGVRFGRYRMTFGRTWVSPCVDWYQISLCSVALPRLLANGMF